MKRGAFAVNIRFDREEIIIPGGTTFDFCFSVIAEVRSKFSVMFRPDKKLLHRGFTAKDQIIGPREDKTFKCTIHIPKTRRTETIPSTGELIVDVDTQRIRRKLPSAKIVPFSSYFQLQVKQDLEDLGFKCKRIDAKGKPHIVATSTMLPNDVLDVECAVGKKYTLNEFHRNCRKFENHKRKYGFTRLLIVTYSPTVEADVLNELKKKKNCSLVAYPSLQRLRDEEIAKVIARMLGQFLVDKHLKVPTIVGAMSCLVHVRRAT